MNRIKRILGIIICFYPIVLIASLHQINFARIKIDSFSQEVIYRGYEKNVINGQVAILVEGGEFETGDIIYLNGQEQTTSVSNETTLSFLLPPEVYADTDTVEVQIKRFNSIGKLMGKSNTEVIKIEDVEEKTDMQILKITEIGPNKIVERQQGNLDDGQLAMTVYGKGFSEKDQIYINGEVQQTAFGGEEVLTCIVPKRMYTKAGTLDIQVKQEPIPDENGDATIYISNVETIQVHAKNNDPNNWYESSNKIMHAMGEIDGYSYTNSYEAFEHNYSLGHRIFEVDLIMTSDNNLVARHDWTEELLISFEQDETIVGEMDYETFKGQPIHNSLTPLGIEDIINIMVEHPDMYIVTDTKETDISMIEAQFTQIYEVANSIDSSVLKRIIPQIYNMEMLDIINCIYDWENPIYTIYQTKQGANEIIDSVKEKNIKVVTMPEYWVTQDFIDQLLANDVYVYVHTINDTELAQQYYRMGIYGMYTDSLRETD